MTSRERVLRPATAEDLADCAAFLARLVRLDDSALVRLQASAQQVTPAAARPRVTSRAGRPHVMLWAAPLGVVLRLDLRAAVHPPDTTVAAVALLAAVDAAAEPIDVALPAARDGDWRRTLPPAQDWVPLDEVPADVVRRLADTAARVVREAADPETAGEALLDQQTLLVSAGEYEVSVPVRVVTALARMGFLGSEGSDLPADVVRIGCTPTWLRAAARHGTVYLRRGGDGLSLA